MARHTSACNRWGSALRTLGRRFVSCRPDHLKTKSYKRAFKTLFLLGNLSAAIAVKMPSSNFTVPSLASRRVTIFSNEKREPPQLVLEHNHKYQIAYIPFVHQITFFQLRTYQATY